MTEIPRIGITLGDPAGIGPEIIVKALARAPELPQAAYVLFGPAPVIAQEQSALGIALSFKPFTPGDSAAPPGLYHSEVGLAGEPPPKGEPSAAGGRASFVCFERAVNEARAGNLEAVVTAPVSKLAWSMAGVKWRGHTEYLAQFYPGAIMAFWSDALKIALLSHHVSLREALSRVQEDILERFLLSLRDSLGRLSKTSFKFLVAGLNPHAGEGGLMGDEERQIRTAVEKARSSGMAVEGPLPPDMVFRLALGHPEVLVVALYHDQGLIPFKLEAFETGVNVTLGLPFVRTSPDHGTAFDIAPRREADPGSFEAAIGLAFEFVAGRG